MWRLDKNAITMTNCDAPCVYRGAVKSDWIDVNGHMNVAWYCLAFDFGIDGLWEQFGISQAERERSGTSTFAVESHVRYLSELLEGDEFVVHSRILAVDEKRMHQFQYLFAAKTGALSATCEWLHLHVNLNNRKVSPWPAQILSNIQAHPVTNVAAPWPAAAGQAIRIAKPLSND